MATTEKRILLAGGKEVGQIPVHLSYQIIKHFSAGLYTSPYKAIEELVANSYDAWAPHVHVILPDNVSSSVATIWVIDDGESMDVSGFKELWRIGESNKRNTKRNSSKRPPIGKFGIGKDRRTISAGASWKGKPGTAGWYAIKVGRMEGGREDVLSLSRADSLECC